MQQFHSISATEGNFEVKLHEFLNTENEQHMNNLLMAFAPCQQLCWRKWSWWSPPGHQEVKDRQRDHRTPFCEAGWCGELPNTRLTQCPNSWGWERSHHSHLWWTGTGSFMRNRCCKGGKGHQGWRLRMESLWPRMAPQLLGQHRPTLHWEAAAAPTPIHLLFTVPGTNLSLFSPSPLQPRAVPPHSTPCPTSSISSAPQLPHQVSYLPSKDLRTYSGTCKQLTSLRHPPVPQYKSNFTKNLNNGSITETKSVSPNLPKSLYKI